MTKQSVGGRPRVLMVGYNGANNTGAEALLQADIRDLRAVMGPRAHITVPTLNESNLRRYLKQGPGLTISPIPTLFFAAIGRMVSESDLVLLVEGSTYMDTWGSPLLWFFLWASRCAARMGKPSLAYAVDSGSLSRANERRVRDTATTTDLIITRNEAAAARLKGIGVTAPIASTADNAFVFEPDESEAGWVSRSWPLARNGLVGIAPVDFSLFPAVARLWGRRANCYRWPYYFSCSKRRSRYGEMLARSYAELADHVVESSGKSVALVCMEQLDEAIAEKVHGLMRHPERARIFSARHHNASQMTLLLRSLDLLVTSRYHAAVLSLAAGVPQVAMHHDTRLATLYRDLGLAAEWFIDPCFGDCTNGTVAELEATRRRISCQLRERVDALLSVPDRQRGLLKTGYEEHLGRARRNRELLAEFVGRHLGFTAAGGPGEAPAKSEPAATAGGEAWTA